MFFINNSINMSIPEIKALEEEISSLEATLRFKKQQLLELKYANLAECPYSEGFSSHEITRYSRQMIMPQIRKEGQLAIKQSKVLIVGAGGLGCPASLFLAAAGIGEIHILDYDEVELSNLHRQVLHYESDIGRPKVESVCNKLKSLNGDIVIVPLHVHASHSLSETVQKHSYDVVLDCTDNAPTRYLLNDICVFNKIPLVSGSALQMEGQLTVYNYKGGPCYRCLFPTPPPPHTVTNCGDGGVLGTVTGIIGTLQALECLKIVTKSEGVLNGRLLLFDGCDSSFRNVKLRQKVKTCNVCGENPKTVSLVDYEQFCGSRAHDKVVNIDIVSENVSVDNLPPNAIIIDVRPKLEFEMCKIPNSINLPFLEIVSKEGMEKLRENIKNTKEIFILCRRGNDSQRAVKQLRQYYFDPSVRFFNIKGGLHAYSNIVDSRFPIY